MLKITQRYFLAFNCFSEPKVKQNKLLSKKHKPDPSLNRQLHGYITLQNYIGKTCSLKFY